MSPLSPSICAFCCLIRILTSPRKLLTDIFTVVLTTKITTTSTPAGNHP